MSENNDNRHIESFEDPLQHLWAISYADLLMVLLCFFIVYDVKPAESEEKENPTPPPPSSFALMMDNLLPKASNMIFGKKFQLVIDNNKKDEGKEPSESPEKISAGDLATLIETEMISKDFRLDYREGSKDILVHMDNDTYESGKFMMSESLKDRVSKLLNILKPYDGKIDLVFVGHADSTPVSERLINKGVISNMVLSSMRAAVAADLAIVKGFAPERIKTEGNGIYARNSRTLSIKITNIVHGDVVHEGK